VQACSIHRTLGGQVFKHTGQNSFPKSKEKRDERVHTSGTTMGRGFSHVCMPAP
jgi:hypothetical protein